MVILEGIHALNPDVTGSVSERASGVYVSVRTRMKSKTGAILHPSKIRLMRRLSRDKLFRGREASQTLKFFEKVQEGEKKHILPYKCYAEHDIDTFLGYETAVYKSVIEEDLQALRYSYDEFDKYEGMMIILQELLNVDLEKVPDNSLVREFAGGSTFEY